MKTIKRITQVLVFITTVFFTGCANDDSISLNPSDLNASLDENPLTGYILGTITTNITEDLIFTISSQTPNGAMSINDNGDVMVLDASLFDFETNPVLEATVSVASAAETVTANIVVELNNIDDIASFLSTSKASYMQAAIGQWVQVTESEYNTLAERLNEVTKSGTSDEFYEFAANIEIANGNFTAANDNGHNMPINSYVLAIKYYSAGDNMLGSQVKQSSTSISSDYGDLSDVLPSHNSGENYFVLKGNDTPTTNIGYLGFYQPIGIGFKAIPNTTIHFNFGDMNQLTFDSTDGVILYQGLSTTQKQWD